MSNTRNYRHSSKKQQDLRQLGYPSEIRIKPSDRLDEIQSLASDLSNLLNWFQNFYKKEVPEKDREHLELLSLLCDISIGLWRTYTKMVNPETDEPLEGMSRVKPPVERMLILLRQNGFEIRDLTNKPYVTGMLEEVKEWETKEELTKEIILETISPTIIFREKLLRQGQVIVGVPLKNRVE